MIYILFFLFLLASPVYADDFNTTGDSLSNEYHQTISISRSYVPNSSDEVGGILYDSGLLKGVETDFSLANHSLFNLVDSSFRVRVRDIADFVSGPPGTHVDILYHYFNNTGHDVNVSSILVPLSKSSLTAGDLTSIAQVDGVQPVFRNIFMKVGGYNMVRQGKMKEYYLPGSVESGESGTILLDTLVISHPMDISDISLSQDENQSTVFFTITNQSKEELKYVLVKHDDFELEFDMEVGDQRNIEYTLPKTGNIGSFTLTLPGERTECSVGGTDYGTWTDVNSSTVLARRIDGGWVAGAYVTKPQHAGICVERLPFTITSQALGYEKIEQNDNILGSEEVEDRGEQNHDRPEILGIQEMQNILPKTSKNIF